MSNNISIRNIDPQQITISGAGQPTGITNVYVNDVDVTVGTKAYVVVPTDNNELLNGAGYITAAEETDPTVPSYVKAISLADINSWNDKQDQLVSGSTIKTINSESLLGSGNIEIVSNYVAGDGIDITDNVISNTITSYNDLTDTPTIPTRTSDLVNDSGFITNQVNNLEYYIPASILEDVLPKVSDSGDELYLEDSAPYKLNIELNPSEIEQHTTTGKNLLDSSTIQQTTINDITCVYNDLTQEITFNGTCSADNTNFEFVGTSFESTSGLTTASAHYVSGSVTNYCNIRFLKSDFGGNMLLDATTLNSGNKIISVTSNANNTLVVNRIRFNNGSVANNFTIKVMFADSTDTTYEEYTGGMPSPNPLYPQTIYVNKGENEITISNRNLINPSDPYTGSSNGITTTYNAETQKLSYSGTITSTWAYLTNKIDINLKAGDYTFSRSLGYRETTIIRLYRDSINYQDITIQTNQKSRTATISNDIVAYQIYIANATANTYIAGTYNLQLEYGSTASQIVKHEEENYTIDLDNFETYYSGLTDVTKITTSGIEFETKIFQLKPGIPYYDYAISQGYIDGDILYVNGVFKYTFSSNDDWYISGSNFEVGITGLNAGSLVHYAVCNYLSDKSKVNDPTTESWITTSGPFITVHLDSSLGITTLEDFKDWIDNNDIVAYIVRGGYTTTYDVDGFAEDNPTYLQYKELFENVKAYDGGTRISQVNYELPFDIEASTIQKVSN